jgi:Tfp pilus assembly protein PilF
MLRHLTGEYSNDELIAMADNTNKVSTAYLQLGLRALAEGHRTLALEHFDKSASEIAPWVAEAFLAEALRDRMVRDGAWPYWIGNEGIETSTSR